MILDDIHRIILQRKKHLPSESYVASLFQKGGDSVLKKIAEEASEVIIAAKNRDRGQIIHEMADLWFHCMVLMAAEDLGYQDIFNELEDRYMRKGK